MNHFLAYKSLEAHQRLFSWPPTEPRRVVQCVQRELNQPRSGWLQSAFNEMWDKIVGAMIEIEEGENRSHGDPPEYGY